MFRYTKAVNEYLFRIKQGEKSLYEPLFQLTALHLRKVAKLYLQNKDLAEDVVADAFVKIFKYIDSFDCEQNGYNWMCKIAQNIAITYNVSESKTARLEQKFAKENAELIRDNFNEIEFYEQISMLDEMDKEIMIARFYFGQSLSDIGKRYHLSKVAIFHRIKKICKIIENNRENK